MRQVERHWIKEGHTLYPICNDLTFKAKNLYNAGLYQIRQSIFERNKCDKDEKPSVLSWIELVSQFRKEKQSDMLALPSKVSTNILKTLGSSISSYYKLLKCFHDKSNSSVVRKPQLPRYLHKTEGDIEEDIKHHQLQEIPCYKQGAWDTYLPNNEVNLELCQRLGNMVKTKPGKEEEECHSIEEEEWLNEPPEPPREPTRPKSRRCRSRCTKSTQTQLGHQPIA